MPSPVAIVAQAAFVVMPSSYGCSGRHYWVFGASPEPLSPWRRAYADVGEEDPQQEPMTSATAQEPQTSATAGHTPILPIKEDEEDRARKRRRAEIDRMSGAELMLLSDAELEALVE